MSALEDLLEEVRAEAKVAALKEYENEITRLRAEVEDLILENIRVSTSHDRWYESAQVNAKNLCDLQDKLYELSGH